MNRLRAVLLVGVALVVACSSASSGEDGVAPAPSESAAPAGSSDFARRGFAVAFAQGCKSCHAGDSPVGRVSFANQSGDDMRATFLATSATQLPSMKLVTPGDPDHSYVARKLRGDTASLTCVDGCGERMPLGNYPFAEGDRMDFEQWIKDGAK
jgi:mono/diheme cytochrome c family protein